MIAGEFDGLGQPILRAGFLIPRFGISGLIDFLVDTGASHTCLHPDDGARIQIPFDELQNPDDVIGIGGTGSYYSETATVLLYDAERSHRFEVTLSIAKPQPPTRDNPNPVVNEIPSLLGRDVLNRLRIDYHHPANRLHFYP